MRFLCPFRSRVLLLCGLVGCAAPVQVARPSAGRLPAPVMTARADDKPPNLSGIWDWMHRSSNEQGDLRIEQEEWHLSQEGVRLSGYYDRQVVTLSTDQRPFRCNGALGYTKTMRVKVAGHIEGGRVLLREIAADAQQHPCDSGTRSLMSYVGELQGDSLRLQFAPGGHQFLTRRAGSGRVASVPQELALAPLAGTWEWELRTVDAEGDLRVEREEWHLEESEAGVSGYYERTVHRSRPGGLFPCNNAPEVITTTQYTIRGQRIGDRLSLSEVDFKAQPGPCDNALRRLDTYQGSLAPNGRELLLSWGSGSQVLRRKH